MKSATKNQIHESLIHYALAKLEEKGAGLIQSLEAKIKDNSVNLSTSEKIEVARLYRSWIEELHADSEFNVLIPWKRSKRKRRERHDIIVDALNTIGSSDNPHILKKLQDDLDTIALNGYQIGGLYLPFKGKTNYVSGDTIKSFETKTGFELGIADVMGKDKAVKDALDAKVYFLLAYAEGIYRLADQYAEVNSTLFERFKEDHKIYDHPRMVAASSIILPNVKKGKKPVEFECLGAGNEGLIYTSSTGDFTTISNKNIVMGVFPTDKDKIQFNSKKYNLNIGDIVILYTDGLIESHLDSAAASFGEDLIKMVVSENKDKHPAEISKLLKEEIVRKMNGKRKDDFSIVIVKYTGLEQEK